LIDDSGSEKYGMKIFGEEKQYPTFITLSSE
jgi:hypothetical protein